MISLYKIKTALGQLGADSQKIDDATTKLTELLADLDEITVKGRDNVDTLLGCMMAVEQIIGDEKNG